MRIRTAIFAIATVTAGVGAGAFGWLQMPIAGLTESRSVEVRAGAPLRETVRQVAEQASVAELPLLLAIKLTGNAARIRAGTYELDPGMTPRMLIRKLVRGEIVWSSLTVVEGWTFAQMRQAIRACKELRQDAGDLPDTALMEKIGAAGLNPEGRFFPDTYKFAKGSSDLAVYRQAFETMRKVLDQAWADRAKNLPLATPDDALILASIVEKETARPEDRDRVAAVFVNRLRLGMLLQTDPTVIYGLGEKFDGNLHKRDLLSDTPYNTYTRAGLPPTPIALPSKAAIEASLNPAPDNSLYFVARGDGSSEFSADLSAHNRAVNKYQRRQ